jgi:glycosyltransferase involved in cell wall biosynthesis
VHNTISKELLKGLSSSKKQRAIKNLSTIYTKKPTISVSKGVKEDFDSIFDSVFTSHQIYNPIDVDFVRGLSLKNTPNISNYLVHVGKFKYQKRHDILIRAYHLSNVKNPLVLVGQGPLQKKCEELVNDLGLNKKVIFAGFKSNPYPLIKNAELMVFSSEYEGLGLVILESLVLDTPVISTDCESGPREMLPKKNLVTVNSVEELANKISDAVNNPIQYSSKINNNFYLKEAISHYLNLLH